MLYIKNSTLFQMNMLYTWKKKMTMMPMAAYMQKDLRAGRIVVAPMPKAMKSVIEVIVMATPA